jgi:hypothetical protein
MKIDAIGLGRMGGNMCRRLMRAGHRCVVFDINDKPRESLSQEGATAVESLAKMVQALQEKPSAIWVMLPAGEATEETVVGLSNLLERGDIIVDGGNSYYKDDIRRAKKLSGKGIRYVDCGTSGGVWGIERGYCMMIGGPKEAVGVSGSGKTTISTLLAAALGRQSQEGDDLHPRENVEKMRVGTLLTDADRMPWLYRIAEEIDSWRAGRVRSSDLLGTQAIPLRHHYRRSPGCDAGLPQRIARYYPPAHGREARAFRAGRPARQPVCSAPGTHAGRASDHRRRQRQAVRDRSRDRASTEGPAKRWPTR